MIVEVGCWFQPSTVFVQRSTTTNFNQGSYFPQLKRFPRTKRAYSWPKTDAWELLKQDLGDNEVHILPSSSDTVVETLNYITSFVNEWSTERTKEEPQRSRFLSFSIGNSHSKTTNFLITEYNGRVGHIKKMLV